MCVHQYIKFSSFNKFRQVPLCKRRLRLTNISQLRRGKHFCKLRKSTSYFVSDKDIICRMFTYFSFERLCCDLSASHFTKKNFFIFFSCTKGLRSKFIMYSHRTRGSSIQLEEKGAEIISAPQSYSHRVFVPLETKHTC